MTQPNHTSLKDFLENRTSVADALDEISQILGMIGGGASRKVQLHDTRERLLLDDFRLMIVGEFKRGKSTLINALLGENILPTRVAPCTALITEIRYDEEKYALLHPHDATGKPTKIGIDEIEKYVTIDLSSDDITTDATTTTPQSPYSRLEIRYPLELSKNHITIVDSPGLNEHNNRTEVALNFIDKADALVMVLSCQQALSRSELQFLDEELGDRDLNNMFFVWNYYDVIYDSPNDIRDIQLRSKQHLEPRIGDSSKIFYLSSKDALLGKMKGDEQRYQDSQFEAFQNNLVDFLVQERGRIKLLGPVRTAETAADFAINELIPQEISLLAQPIAEIETLHEKQKPKLKAAQRQREHLLNDIERHRLQLSTEIRKVYEDFVTAIETDITPYLDTIEVGLWDVITRRKQVQKRVQNALSTWLKHKSIEWRKDSLEPLLSSHSQDLEDSIDDHALEFLSIVDELKVLINPKWKPTQAEENISATSRLLGATSGWIIGGVGSAIEGGSMGFASMLRGLFLNIATSAGLIVMGLSFPLVLSVLAILGVFRTIIGAESTADKMKRKMKTELLNQLKLQTPTTLEKIDEQLTKNYEKITSVLDDSMQIQIQEIQEAVADILERKQQAELESKSRRAVLDECIRKLEEQKNTLSRIKSSI